MAVPAGGTTILDLTGTMVAPYATAVILNVTATDAKSSGYLTVYADGKARPTASSLNWSKGKTISNLVTVPVTSGRIVFYNHSTGTVDVVADTVGYFAQ